MYKVLSLKFRRHLCKGSINGVKTMNLNSQSDDKCKVYLSLLVLLEEAR